MHEYGDYIGADGYSYNIGSWVPFLLGFPIGVWGGYFLRKWQEEHPGLTIPGVAPGTFPAPKILPPSPKKVPPQASGDWIGGPWLDIEEPGYAIGGPWLDVEEPGYAIGGPWLDVEEPGYTIGGPWLDIEEPGYAIGGPWVDVVGAQVDDLARKRAWPQTKALIQSAIHEVAETSRRLPAEAYVWSLDPPSPGVTSEEQTAIWSFGSPAEALDYMRDRIQTPHVALALFDRRSPHWPNPTNWTKSNDPGYEAVIARQITKFAPTRMAGNYVGAVPGQTAIGAALEDVRARAQSIANKRDGRVIGVIHTTKDGLWHALAFRDADDADDWLGTATQDPAGYTYAAYYDKEDFQWPHSVNEKIGGPALRGRAGRAA